jgi:hypothetical protein
MVSAMASVGGDRDGLAVVMADRTAVRAGEWMAEAVAMTPFRKGKGREEDDRGEEEEEEGKEERKDVSERTNTHVSKKGSKPEQGERE